MSDKDFLISIVIPVYNRENVIKRTLESVLAQEYRPLHLILIDNNSTDNTRDIMERWALAHQSPEFRITVDNEPLRSASAARNKGLSLVTTPYVMFFDSDDTMRPKHTGRAAATFLAHPTVDIAGWDVLCHLSSGMTVRRPFAATNPLFRNTFNGTMSTLRYAVRTSLVREAGGWNPDVRGWDDYELGMRLIALNPSMIHCGEEITVDVYESEVSITGTDYSSAAKKWENSLDRCEETFRKNGWPVKWLDLRRIILAALYSREKSPEGKRLLSATIAKYSLATRLLLQSAYLYTLVGGRGIHRIMRHLLS